MKRIALDPPLCAPAYRTLFDALEAVLDVSFQERRSAGDDGIDAAIVLAADRESLSRVSHATRPCFVVLGDHLLAPCGASSTVRFSTHPAVTAVLRGRQVMAADAVELKALPEWLDHVTPLAWKDGLPFWALEDRGRVPHQYVSAPLPVLLDGEPLFAHLDGARFLAFLPLFLFLRDVTEDPRWEFPALQATFMFDDPNLHWTTYGFLRFADALRHALAHDYHVAFATIPLDAWFVHRPTAALFSARPERLSLLFHGNDHVASELARNGAASRIPETLRQALDRIGRMEARTGLRVARVMAPPHGAVSERTLIEMARLEFEAVCVSRGSLRHQNRDAPWSRTIGMRPADMIGALPVVPRFALSQDCHQSVLVAAILRQPIVPVAHHQAVADGYAPLDDLASFINGLGAVRWGGMTAICRSLYAHRREGDVVVVRMLSRRVAIDVPPDTTHVRVERPRQDGDECAAAPLLSRRRERAWMPHSVHEDIPVAPGETVELLLRAAASDSTETRRLPSRGLFPVGRRILTETRDRTAPWIRRLTARGARLLGV